MNNRCCSSQIKLKQNLKIAFESILRCIKLNLNPYIVVSNMQEIGLLLSFDLGAMPKRYST